ncbi:hypothetical protein HDU83_002633 [Entophlyctis luteolus]|nr:hypothetical protein HDU83_002633 [Entophlyctis luteolus]
MSDDAPAVARDLKVKSSYASGATIADIAIADAITTTGALLSPPNSRDVQIEKFSLQAYGRQLVKDSDLTLLNGRRYGLIAPNGSGKSTILHAIACGLVPTPAALDYYLLDREFGATEMTALEAVLDITEQERGCLMDEMEELLDDPNKHMERLDAIQARLADLEVSGEDRNAREILRGLGFSETLINTKTKDLSGGWRMRISLARVLFVKPTLMMLDEPTNHLDLEAVVWLEEYLVHNLEGHTLVITCHSQDTLNEICTDIIHLYHQKLDYYKGDYNTFTKVRADKTALLTKQAMKEEKKMAKVAENLTKTGTAAQTQAKQKLKNMDKEKEKNKEKNKDLQEELIIDKDFNIKFGECGGGLPPPVLKFNDVTFGYDVSKPPIFKGMNFGLDLDSRIALVGPNGAGKSTLLKLMLGKLEPTAGSVERHHHLRIGQFNQHMGDQLDMERSAVEWLCLHFKHIKPQDMRREVGKFGLTGKSQVVPMKQLSDGQRRRVLFCYLGLHTPHLFLMDEPTNALDIETIDALAEAINEFDGGVVFVTHDFRLIDQVAKEIWIVRDGGIEEFPGDIHDYKAALKAKYAKEREEAAAAALAEELAKMAVAKEKKAAKQAEQAATSIAVQNDNSPDPGDDDDDIVEETLVEKKKSKKKKSKVSPTDVNENDDENVENEEVVEVKKKKKSKSKSALDIFDGDEVSSESPKLSKSKSKSEKVSDDQDEVDDETESSRKKKSKSKSKTVVDQTVDFEGLEVKKKSKSKSKKAKDSDEEVNSIDDAKSKKKSKSKSKDTNEEGEDLAEPKKKSKSKVEVEVDSDDEILPVENVQQKKKSKSKLLQGIGENQVEDEHTPIDVSKKKSKKSKKVGTVGAGDGDAVEPTDPDELSETNEDTFSEKKKSKSIGKALEIVGENSKKSKSKAKVDQDDGIENDSGELGVAEIVEDVDTAADAERPKKDKKSKKSKKPTATHTDAPPSSQAPPEGAFSRQKPKATESLTFKLFGKTSSQKARDYAEKLLQKEKMAPYVPPPKSTIPADRPDFDAVVPLPKVVIFSISDLTPSIFQAIPDDPLPSMSENLTPAITR